MMLIVYNQCTFCKDQGKNATEFARYEVGIQQQKWCYVGLTVLRKDDPTSWII